MSATPPRGPWALPALHGDAERVRVTAAITSGLLAGFSLAAILSIVTSGAGLPAAEWAIVFFSLTVATSLVTLNYQWWAHGFWTSPDAFVSLRPVARVDYHALQEAVAVQRHLVGVFDSLVKRARLGYRVSILAFFTANVLVLLPAGGEWTFARGLAVAFLCLGALLFIGTLVHPGSDPVRRKVSRLVLGSRLFEDYDLAPRLDDHQIDAVASSSDAAYSMKEQRDQS